MVGRVLSKGSPDLPDGCRLIGRERERAGFWLRASPARSPNELSAQRAAGISAVCNERDREVAGKDGGRANGNV